MSQMQLKKIVIAGTPGAGKTTFIRSISQIKTVSTERRATDKTSLLKSHTTVGMDFGKMNIYDDLVLHLYGTPGQSRFNFMWEVLITKADAYMLLVAANRPQEFQEVRQIMNFMNRLVTIPMIVGLTHIDSENALSPLQVATELGFDDPRKKPPFVTLNATSPQSIKKALIALLKHLKAQQIQNQSLQLADGRQNNKMIHYDRAQKRFRKSDFLKTGFCLH